MQAHKICEAGPSTQNNSDNGFDFAKSSGKSSVINSMLDFPGLATAVSYPVQDLLKRSIDRQDYRTTLARLSLQLSPNTGKCGRVKIIGLQFGRISFWKGHGRLRE